MRNPNRHELPWWLSEIMAGVGDQHLQLALILNPSVMKTFLGIALVIIGLCAGLYFGLWWAFIGGIVALIQAIKAPELSAMLVALDIARIVLASAIGTLCAVVFIVPGMTLLRQSSNS
jgi:hypothetical protein